MQSFTKIAKNGSKVTMDGGKKFSLPSLPSFGKKAAPAPKKAGTAKVGTAKVAPKKAGTVVKKAAPVKTGTRAGGVGEHQKLPAIQMHRYNSAVVQHSTGLSTWLHVVTLVSTLQPDRQQDSSSQCSADS